MSYKSILFTYAIIAIALISIQCITANLNDNEVNDFPETYRIQGVEVFPGDRECVLVGGLCVHHSDCNEPTSKKGLCPSNTHRGVECCYELPVRPAPCREHLGECMDRCHRTLMRPGTDCANGQVCCVLVN